MDFTRDEYAKELGFVDYESLQSIFKENQPREIEIKFVFSDGANIERKGGLKPDVVIFDDMEKDNEQN